MNAVLDFVNERLGDCHPKVKNQIGIAIDEIFSNIVRYAYDPAAGTVVIRMAVSDEIVIEFEDTGKPYNPLEKKDPDVTLGADERETGGLGIFMVKKIMDTVEYRYADNKNILTIRKAIA
jgi:anti-sigma regulatory factor (Ser/Thr protein kinase)